MLVNPERAMMFAEIAHSGQTYNDEVPYVYHVRKVVEVLKRFHSLEPLSPELECAACLHDVLEDTNKSFNDIKERFGVRVAELVYTVTNELGRNRDERNAKTYPKIKGHQEATMLKLADRIANVEFGSANGGMVDRYRKEYQKFKDGIRFPLDETPIITRMWAHLDSLLEERKETNL